MIRYHATWVLPIVSAPLRDGYVFVDGDTIVDVSSTDGERVSTPPSRDVDLTDYALLPSLVNAHTHLELSGLRGMVRPAASMPEWAGEAMAHMASHPPDAEAIRAAIRESLSSGTGLFGDISNTLASIEVLAEERAEAVVFRELLGFNEPEPVALVRRELDVLSARLAALRRPVTIRGSVAAHAPYSVSPGLFRAIQVEAAARGLSPLSVHGAESREELQFLETGSGPWRNVLEERDRWTDDWTPKGGGCLAYLAECGWSAPATILVHGVHLREDELVELARVGAGVVTCPRSNAWTGAGTPPVESFYECGVRVGVGTDSLASAPDLNMFSELAAVRGLAPSVSAATVLRSGTQVGAELLGYSDRGVLAKGFRASMIAVKCPPSLQSSGEVEEYLLSGIDPTHVVWPHASVL